jgi:xylulokinase
LNIGTPVLAGLPDLAASSISVGVVDPEEAIIYYGTAGVMPILKGHLIDSIWKSFPEQERLPKVGIGFEGPSITGPRGISGYVYDYPAYCLSTGDAVRWFHQLFGAKEDIDTEREDGPSVYARLDQLAARTPPGSDGLLFIPHLQGQRSPEYNPAATGIYFGITINHTRGHFFRAVLESFGYEILRGLEAFYPEGIKLERVVATGGGAQSPLWLQIVSDITGFQQEYVPIADGSLADAYLAGIALGWYDDFKTLKDDWVQVKAVIKPIPENRHSYEKFFHLYCDLHGAVGEPYLKHYHSMQLIGEE